MLFKSGVAEFCDQYEYFIFDVWGVIHDGTKAYPHAFEAISFLRQKGKKICFLSNAPRRSIKVADVLARYGINAEFYDFILTSGEATFFDLQQDQKKQKFGKNYFYIGPNKDIDLLQGLDYQRVDSAADADFVITTGFDHDHSTLAEKMPQALEAIKFNLPMICVNPDMIVVKQNGQEMICAGALALEYEKMKGKVIYYGKPFAKVYEMTCDLFGSPNKSKVIAIGDGLETDIKGANDFGIDSVLITGGILANKLGINYTQNADATKLNKICSHYQIFPKIVIPNLKI